MQELLESHPDSADLTHVNMLSELLIREGQPGQVLELIQQAAATLCADDGLPIELQVRRPHHPRMAQHDVPACMIAARRMKTGNISFCRAEQA